MKILIASILTAVLIFIGFPFLIVDVVVKNRWCEMVLNKINNIILWLNWWGNRK